jgi:hypothetical protein
MSDFVQSIEHGNRSASRSGWRRCVAVVATSSPHRGSRVRQSTTVPVRQLRPLRILKAGLSPAPSWRAQKRKKRTPSRNSPWQRNDILQFRLPLSPSSLMNGFWHETKSKTEWKKQATAPDRDLWQQTKSSVGSLLRLSIYRRRRPVEKLNWSSSANWGRRALLVNSRQQKQGERRAEQVERGHGSIWNKVFTVSRKTYRIFKPNDFGLAAIHSHNNTCNREQES